MFPGGTPFGFYNAPVSKALLAITGAASTLNVLFPFFKYQTLIRTGAFSYIQDSKVFHGILHSICYSNVKNLFFGSLLLYNFRIFEHRYGSKKFATLFLIAAIAEGDWVENIKARMIILTLLKRIIALLIQDYIVASTIIGAGLQYVLILAQHLRVEEIPTGPFAMIFSFYVPFFLLIPSVNSSTFFGLLPSTGKLFTYMFGLQMLLTSKGTALSGLTGIIAGVVCHFNILYVKRWLVVPSAISKICSRIFGSLFSSDAPEHAEKLQGATVEIQREIRMDELDQQMWSLQQMNVPRRVPVIGRPFAATAPAAPSSTSRSAEAIQQPTTEVSEEQIERLMEMGFTRYAVLQALTASNNNIAMAMNILLSE